MRRMHSLATVLLCIVLLVGATGCADDQETEVPAEYCTHQNWGFSFEHPGAFRVTELGLIENRACDYSGMVQAVCEDGEREVIQISWGRMLLNDQDIDGVLRQAIATGAPKWTQAGTVTDMESVLRTIGLRFERGATFEESHSDSRVLCQCYSVESRYRRTGYGVIGAFYCCRCHRVFVLMRCSTAISEKDAILNEFESLLDSFACCMPEDSAAL